MSAIHEVFAAAASPVIADLHGLDAQYIARGASGGQAVRLRSFAFHSSDDQHDADAQANVARAEAILQTAGLTPAPADRLTIAGRTWAVDSVMEAAGGGWLLRLVASAVLVRGARDQRLRGNL